MRVLVIADDTSEQATRLRDLERAGVEACGAADAAHATARVRATRPEALLIVAPAETSALRLLLSRVRAAAEVPLPALVLLEESSVWLRTALPDDLAPASVLSAREADGARIAAALDALAAGVPQIGTIALGAVTFTRSRHGLAGPGGEAALTPSEAAVLTLLATQPGAFVSAAEFARALWGEPLTDRHARGAIRSHVHTLRGKLTTAGFDGGVEARSGVGYRIVLVGGPERG